MNESKAKISDKGLANVEFVAIQESLLKEKIQLQESAKNVTSEQSASFLGSCIVSSSLLPLDKVIYKK